MEKVSDGDLSREAATAADGGGGKGGDKETEMDVDDLVLELLETVQSFPDYRRSQRKECHNLIRRITDEVKEQWSSEGQLWTLQPSLRSTLRRSSRLPLHLRNVSPPLPLFSCSPSPLKSGKVKNFLPGVRSSSTLVRNDLFVFTYLFMYYKYVKTTLHAYQPFKFINPHSSLSLSLSCSFLLFFFSKAGFTELQMGTEMKIERKSSIDKEPQTLFFDQIQYAREAALYVLSTKTMEEALRIFTEGLQPVSIAEDKINFDNEDLSNFIDEHNDIILLKSFRDIDTAPF